jgi:hypothetical protein
MLRAGALVLVWVLVAAPASAQAPAPLPPAAAAPQPLSAAELDAMLAPYAGAPPDALGQVLDAARYPADLMAASAWARQPAESRGEPNPAWLPTIRQLAERAPRTLDYLTQNMAATAAVGSAYQNQPNDVWLAFGRGPAPSRGAAGSATFPGPGPTG